MFHLNQKKHSILIGNARGVGTFIAVDFLGHIGPRQRDSCLARLLKNGVLAAGCGNQSLRLRPALIFKPLHAELFLDRFEKSLSQL
ncbi:unnamed protein product [Protopolystoma xenopodis]|uniref:Uncharacterized protein n=1 Tax=Protopolystoma xenopodis TaxID=117903 RepID=A0A3S5C7R0_9PLAT|nr:unnamed protein product [Protopolystoma xenopodis]